MSKMATRSASTEVDEAVSCSNGNSDQCLSQSDIIDVDGEMESNADTGVDNVINKNGIQLTSTLQHVSGTLNLFTHDDTSSDSNDLSQTPEHSVRKFPFHKNLCDVRTGLPVSDDLRHGYRVLKELSMTSCRSVNTIFMTDLGSTPVNPVLMNPQLPPLTLPIIQRKFENSEYTTLTDFVRDFRVMLERSIRYFGPEHSVVKKIQKFETMLEQKLALLKRKYQDMTTIEMTHPSALSDVTSSLATQTKPKRNSRSFTSNLILALKEEMKEKDRESRKQQIALREKEREERKHELACWEASLFTDSEKEQMLSSWELPQIGLFLYLCQEPLNCGGIPHYEVERMVLLCQQSLSMALVMTSLLSTPYQRQYLDRKPPMPYEVWNAKLSHRLDSWYKTLQDCDKDFNMAADRLGVEHMFWHVVGRLRNPLLSKSFHELSFYQRIWIIKSLCDASVSTESSLRDVLDEQDADETRSYQLGTDSSGATYLHFPQFCGDHLRIYRLKPHQTTSTTSRRGGGKRKQVNPPSSGTHAKTRALRSSPTIQVCDSPTSSVTDRAAKTSSDKENTQTFSQSDARALRLARRSEFYHGLSNHRLSRKSKRKRESVTVEPDSADSVRGNAADESSLVSDESNSRQGASDTLPNSSDCLSSGNSLNETPEHVVKTETGSDPSSQREEKQLSELADVSSEQTSLKEEEVSPKKEVEVKEDSSSVEEEDGLITEPTDFQSYRLICQSVEDLRELAQQFSGSRGREGELYDSLSHLLSELTPWESKLLALDTKAKEKMKKECESYIEQTSVAADGWESDSPASADDDNGKEEVESQVTGDQEKATTDPTSESVSRKSKSANRAAVSTPEPGNIEEDGQTEFGVSAFGRIRKRRLIPNNAEPRQAISAKKVKRESKADTTESNTSTTTTDVIKQTSTQPAKITDGYVVKVNKQLFMVPKEQLPSLLAQNKSKVQILNHPRILSKANSPLSIKTLGPPARNVSIVRRAPATTCAGDVILAADTVKHVSTAAARLNSSANSILTSTNSTPSVKTTSTAGNNTRTLTVLSSAISKQSAPNPTNSGIKTAQCSVTTASLATARSSLQLATNKTFTVKTAGQINAMRNQNAAISVLPIRSVLPSKLMLSAHSGNQKPVIISSRPPNCPPTLQTRKLLKATVSRKASDSASTLPITGVTNTNLTYATASVSVRPAGGVTTMPVRNVTRAPVANAINGATHIPAVTVSKITSTATGVTDTTKSTNTAITAISIASSNTLCTASTSSQSAGTATSISNLDSLSRTIIQIPASVAQKLCVATAERPTLHSTSVHSVNTVKHGTLNVVRAATAPTSLPNSVKIVTNTDGKDMQHTQPNSSKSEIRYLTLSESINLAGQTKRTTNNIATSAAPLETLKSPIIHTLSSKHTGRGVTVQNIGSPIQLVTSVKQHVRVVNSPTQQAFRVVRSPLQQSIRLISPPAQQPVRLVNSPLQQSIRLVQSPAQQTVRLVNLPATQPVRFVNMSVQQPVQLVKNLQPANNSSAVQPATLFTETTSCVSPTSSSSITISTSTPKLSNPSASGSSNPEASALFGRAVHVAGFERGKQHLVLVSDPAAPSVSQSNTPKISSSS